MASLQDVTSLLRRLSVSFGADITDSMCKVYHEKLEKFSMEVLEETGRAYEDDPKSVHFPRPGMLLSLANQIAAKMLGVDEDSSEREPQWSPEKMPKLFLEMLADLGARDKLNQRIRPNMPEAEKVKLDDEIQKNRLEMHEKYQDIAEDDFKRVQCAACFGGGFALSYTTCPVTKLPVERVRPCECEAGDKYRKSYRCAVDPSLRTDSVRKRRRPVQQQEWEGEPF